MPSLALEADSSLEFFYTDSGRPSTHASYATFVVIHGHTFHSGTFQRLLPIAASRGLRIICVNRRGYPGSTPYTVQESRSFVEGSDTERTELLHEQGANLALFVDGLIVEHALPESGGGVVLVAWSLGNIFLLALLNSLASLPNVSRQRLSAYVKSVVMWDPPVQVFGVEPPTGNYSPLFDNSIPPAERRLAFMKWVSSYWAHGDLSARDPAQLNFRHPDASKKTSIENMTPEELTSLTEFLPSDLSRSETALLSPAFRTVLMKLMQQVMSGADEKLDVTLWHLYGGSSSWNVIYAAWALEGLAEAAQDQTQNPKFSRNVPSFRSICIQEANHFLMWDEPEKAIRVLSTCVYDP